VLQEDGYGRIVGRLKDVIIRIGDKIFPVEIEEFFVGHPDVLEAQVKSTHDNKTVQSLEKDVFCAPFAHSSCQDLSCVKLVSPNDLNCTNNHQNHAHIFRNQCTRQISVVISHYRPHFQNVIGFSFVII
jgi:acyl-CoA synthetase (AMP-forming)/AMP-acid ligase II